MYHGLKSTYSTRDVLPFCGRIPGWDDSVVTGLDRGKWGCPRLTSRRTVMICIIAHFPAEKEPNPPPPSIEAIPKGSKGGGKG